MWNYGVFDLVGTKALLPVVTLSTITGGTGAYESASGWMGMIFDDVGTWKGVLKGETCTPDHDDDSDSD